MQKQAHGSKNAHPTKSGPGRYHRNGEKHGFTAKPVAGGFSGQHTNPKRNAERKLMKLHGKRQMRLSGGSLAYLAANR